MSKIEKRLSHSFMKGYEKLLKELQEILGYLDASISNEFNEFLGKYNDYQQKLKKE